MTPIIATKFSFCRKVGEAGLFLFSNSHPFTNCPCIYEFGVLLATCSRENRSDVKSKQPGCLAVSSFGHLRILNFPYARCLPQEQQHEIYDLYFKKCWRNKTQILFLICCLCTRDAVEGLIYHIAPITGCLTSRLRLRTNSSSALIINRIDVRINWKGQASPPVTSS